MKEFSSLLLDIQNISDEDKLHILISGMLEYAQNDLCRQKVQNLPSAIPAADAFIDFWSNGVTTDPTHFSKMKNKEKAQDRKKDKRRQ